MKSRVNDTNRNSIEGRASREANLAQPQMSNFIECVDTASNALAMTSQDLARPLCHLKAIAKDTIVVDARRSGIPPDLGIAKKKRKLKLFLKEAMNSNSIDDCDCENLRKEGQQRLSLKRSIPIGAQIKFLLFSSHFGILLLPCIPAGFAVNYVHTDAAAVFCVNFAAMVPSAAILSSALNEISVRAGDKLSALLNMTFG
jgi:Ca2+:H+ antiporter